MRAAVICALVLLAGCSDKICHPTGEFGFKQQTYGSRFTPLTHAYVKMQKMQCDDGSTEYWDFEE